MRDRTESSSSRSVAERLVHALAGRDLDTVLELTSPDVEYRLGSIASYTGHAGMRTLVEDHVFVAPVVEERFLTVVVQDEVVVVEHEQIFLTVHGPVTIPAASLMRVVDGLVVQMHEYKDTRELARALGY